MRITCNVIRDILPLYAENMVSEDTRKIVEEHINNCDKCKKELEDMKTSIDLPIDTDMTPLKKIKASIRKKKLQAVIFTAMLTIAIITAVIGFLTVPRFIPYHEGLISFMEKDNGMIIVVFNDEVTGYDISSYPSETDDGLVYHITTWDSIWNRNIMKKSVNNIVLNPKGEKVVSVYYYNGDGREDILIYGKDQNPNGGLVTLPRLVLGYYLILSLLLTVLSGIILFIGLRKEHVRNIMLKVFLLPISYIIAHIIIKGFITSSYSAERDFFAILLVTIPLYIAFISAASIIEEYRKKQNNKGL